MEHKVTPDGIAYTISEGVNLLDVARRHGFSSWCDDPETCDALLTLLSSVYTQAYEQGREDQQQVVTQQQVTTTLSVTPTQGGTIKVGDKVSHPDGSVGRIVETSK